MSEERQTRPRGRQPKDPEERKTNSVTFRITDALKQALEQSAMIHSRTLSEEIGHRLLKSFSDEAESHRKDAVLDSFMHENEVLRAAIHRFGQGYTAPDRPTAESILAKGGPGDPPPETIPAPDWFPSVPPAAAATPDLHATIKSAVIDALRETLPSSLTNRGAVSEPREPPKVTPEASPAEQASWQPIVETTNPDEPASDGRPGKAARKKPLAE